MNIFKKKEKPNLTDEEKKFNKKKKFRKIMNTLMAMVIFFGLLGASVGVSLIYIILQKCDVELNPSDLNNLEMSMVYDKDGDLIAELGYESRINVPYSDFPQSLVDAFVSVEDSRYFTHNGFDTPRFAKAFLENIRSLSFGQGGSTLTMQTIKNTYFAVDTIAEKSIPRKVQEIALSMKITKMVSKEKLFELYVNKINFGGTSRGVEVASHYYFGKPCTDLSMVECAMLAGIVQLPNSYDPYFHLDNCNQRTRDVLYLMHYHGYISDEEYALAKKVDVGKLLVGFKDSEYIDGQTIPNQAYLDIVLNELEDVYGIDPYSTAVRVYTGMSPIVQQYCDKASDGGAIKFVDNYVNIAMVAVQNYSGLIVGVCGGRNYNRARIFNYAYDGRVQPGSTSKTVLTYPLAFEYCGLATSYCFWDEPIYWAGTRTLILNDTKTYYGDLPIQKAFTNSYNIPSVKLYRWISQVISYEKIMQYLKNLGFDPFMYEGLNEMYAIGGSNFVVSPVQMAAVESALLSGGLYTEPHTITKIEFINSDKEPIIADPEQRQILSAGAAWLTTYEQMLCSMGRDNDISDYYFNNRAQIVRQNGYNTYVKTGTSNIDYSITKAYGMPDVASKDQWLLFGTNDYGCSVWYGYDFSKHLDKTTYISSTDVRQRYDSHLAHDLLASIEKAYGKPKNVRTRPSSVVKMTHILAKYPYTAVPSWLTDEQKSKYTKTGWILSQYANLQSYKIPDISSLENVSASTTVTADAQIIHVSMSPYPDEAMTKIAEPTVDIPVYYRAGQETPTIKKGDRLFDDTFICGPINYYVDILKADGTFLASYREEVPDFSIDLGALLEGGMLTQDTTLIIRGYYKYTVAPAQSNTIETAVTIRPVMPEISYQITSGKNTTWTKGSETDTTITVQRSYDNASTINHFLGIEVDGYAIDQANYYAEAENFRVSLRSSYLETLTEGTHYIRVMFDDGMVDAAIRIMVNQVEPDPTPDPENNG